MLRNHPPKKSATLQSDAVVKRLHGLHPSLIDLSLDRTYRLLEALGNPHENLPCPVHVAGTNGKGSFLAFMQAIGEAAGLTVHRYTSPHLVRFAERMTVAGKPLSEDALVALLEECEEANAGREITFFEITTATAFLAFSRTDADITLIETGLGGRFDATNVIEKPALTAITPVAMDHMRFLGNTLDAIAFEKAGILKPGVPAVIAKQASPAQRVIEARAAEIGAPLIRQGYEWDVESGGNGICLFDGDDRIDLPVPALPGRHQHDNAAQAVIAARRLAGFQIGNAPLAAGLKNAIWPGRMQRVTEGNIVSSLPAGWELWLDGGHNEAAAEIIAAFAENWQDRPLILVFGALNSRDPGDFLEKLVPVAAKAVCIEIPGEASALPAADCADAARNAGIDSEQAGSIAEAVNRAAATADSGRILVCGSLYLAGAFLAQNKTPP